MTLFLLLIFFEGASHPPTIIPFPYHSLATCEAAATKARQSGVPYDCLPVDPQ